MQADASEPNVIQEVTLNAVMKPLETGDGGLYGDGSLTGKQAEFVKLLVSGVPQGKAAELAGYTYPDSNASRLVRLPHVQAAIQRESQRVLLTDGVANALSFMVKGPANEKLPGAVRFQCAKWVMEAAGHGLAAQRAALGLPDSDKPLSEMSINELDAFLAAGRGAIAQMKAQEMRTIDGSARNVARDEVADRTQVIDYTGD